MKKTATGTTVIILLLIVAVVGYYAYLSNKSRAQREDNTMTAVQNVMSRNLNNDYPATPKEVIKYYNEIIRCLYNEEIDDGDIDSLGLKARDLYDDELLEANELASYQINLRRDVKDYRDNERRFVGFGVAASTNVDTFDKDGYSFAKLMCTYNISQSGKTYAVKIMYLLRKDDNRRWKIYGWENSENLEDTALKEN